MNDGAVSWYDFAMLAAVRRGRPLDLIAPVSAAALIGAAARPAFTGLTSCRGQLLRPIDSALAEFFGEIHDHEVGPDGIDTGMLKDIGERLFGKGSVKK